MGWLKRSAPATNGVPEFNEQDAVREAMSITVRVMNDEYDEAEAELRKGDTPFHKLGLGCVCFLRALLGMQKEDIEVALKALADSEHINYEFMKKAQANPASAHQSAIYPPGTEYALAHAESQLMYAVCAVLNASYIESVKGLLKLRKGYSTLHDIHEQEKKYLKSIGHGAASVKSASIRPTSRSSSAFAPLANGNAATVNGATAVDEDDDDFQDAEEDLGDSPTANKYQGNIDANGIAKLNLNGHSNGSALPATEHVNLAEEDDFDFSAVSTDPIDIFIHAGVGLAFGTMQLVLSLVPPPFDKVLAMFSFKGDRKVGLDMLWGSTRYIEDINGSLAGLINLVFHNGPIAFSQIIPKAALPVERLHDLLTRLRKLYPKSKIWQIEEGVMLSEARQLQPALETFRSSKPSHLNSLQAWGLFEVGLHAAYAHDYELCSRAFLDLLPLSDWSYGLYYFFAAGCHVEMYRDALDTNSGKADELKTKAEGYFAEVFANLGKKKILGRGLPIEIFVKRLMDKYTARAASRKISIVDAVGISPVEILGYFWGGFDCMPDHDLGVTIQRLDWCTKQPGWATETPDEHSAYSLLKGTCLRVMGKYEEARAELTTGVTSLNPKQVHSASGKEACLWQLPTAHYEMAVCYWREAGGETGDKATLQLAADEIHKIAHWSSSYELESIFGLKVSTAAHTLKDLGLHV